MFRERITKDTSVNCMFSEIQQKRGENDYDFRRRMTFKSIILHSKHDSCNFDRNESKSLPDKQTELQVTDEILKDVLIHLENHIRMNQNDGSIHFLAEQFKNIQMKTSPLSTEVIEAALTMIIDQLNDENIPDDELYIPLKQAPVSLTYTHNSDRYEKGICVFEMKEKECKFD